VTGAEALRARLKEARRLTEASDFAGARAILDGLARDPGRDALGPETMLCLPRKVHAAFLRLAKRQGDMMARLGLQATLVPPPEGMAHLLALTSTERANRAAADRLAVPRVIHQVWIGPRPVPPTCAAWADYAARHGYAYRLWRERDLESLAGECRAIFGQMCAQGDFPGAADVARYAILAREGGIYLDCDWYPARGDVAFHDLLPMVGLTAMDEPVPRVTAAGGMLLANSFIAAPPGHPVFPRILTALPDVCAALPGAPAWWVTGPLVFTLAARAGAVSLAGAGWVARAAPNHAGAAELAKMAQANALAGGGPLIAWKPWAALAG
jgi:mannosyltransferase OCH1-like enzyme